MARQNSWKGKYVTEANNENLLLVYLISALFVTLK